MKLPALMTDRRNRFNSFDVYLESRQNLLSLQHWGSGFYQETEDAILSQPQKHRRDLGDRKSLMEVKNKQTFPTLLIFSVEKYGKWQLAIYLALPSALVLVVMIFTWFKTLSVQWHPHQNSSAMRSIIIGSNLFVYDEAPDTLPRDPIRPARLTSKQVLSVPGVCYIEDMQWISATGTAKAGMRSEVTLTALFAIASLPPLTLALHRAYGKVKRRDLGEERKTVVDGIKGDA